jgi:serine/threonine protein kinase
MRGEDSEVGLLSATAANTDSQTTGDDSSDPGSPRGGPGLKAGSRIQHYEVIRSLGRGGMGEVLLARDTRLGRLVAIKLLTAQGGERVQRFLIEARATAQVSHENIVVIHELGDHLGTPYMVLEYLKGKTLHQWLDELRERSREDNDEASATVSARVPPSRAVELMIPVARALVCAHEHGIVHRDLKLSNIMLADTGTIKVLDFGIAKLLGEPQAPPSPNPVSDTPRNDEPAERLALTSPRILLGTKPYMSPEQWRSSPVDHRADVWAAGIILAELVLGRHPLAPLNMLSLSTIGALQIPMPSMRDLCPDIGKLGSIIDRCLIKHGEDRLGSARELLDELTALGPAPLRAATEDNVGPYAGLVAFQEGDSARFFGRARAITEGLTRLEGWPLLAVVGPSGAGKSSFVRAGIIPALRRSGEPWEASIIRPGPRPLAALAELLLSHAFQTSTHDATSIAEALAGKAIHDRDGWITTLRAEPGCFGAQLRARARRRLERILLFVDQFEELYTLASDNDRAAFFACLAGAADDAGSPVRVVLTIRSDFLDRVTEAHAAMIGLSRGLMLLPAMDREGLRDALVRPLEAVEHRFETPELIQELLGALEDTAGALPLLQFTAAALWEQRDRAGRVLTEASYHRLGGVAGALAGHAGAVLSAMSSEERKLARTALLRLVTPERTRAICTPGELRELSAAPEDMDRVLGRLIDARLLTALRRGEAEATIEIVHESLITTWPALAEWVAHNQEDAAFLARLRHAVREWQSGGEADDSLWRGQVAEEARLWHKRYPGELAPGEERFLKAVFALGERSRRRRRQVTAGVLGTSVLIAVAMSYLAIQANREAARADGEATVAQAEAVQARNATRMAVARERQDDPTTALALLREIEPPGVPRGWDALVIRERHTHELTEKLGHAGRLGCWDVPRDACPELLLPHGERFAFAHPGRPPERRREQAEGRAGAHRIPPAHPHFNGPAAFFEPPEVFVAKPRFAHPGG